MLRRALNFDIVRWGAGFCERHRADVQVYVFALACALLAYGAKLRSEVYAGDDYVRFFQEKSQMVFYTGRWAAQWLINTFFSGRLFILPYFNTLFSLALLLLSGLLAAKVWEARGRCMSALVVCLVTITPYWAHNLYFNSNMTVSVGVLCATVSVLLLCRDLRWSPVAFLLLLASLGIYQPSSQVVMLLLLGLFLRRLMALEESGFRALGRPAAIVGVATLLLLMAYAANSFIVRRILMETYNLKHFPNQRSILTVLNSTSLLDVPGNLVRLHREMSWIKYYYTLLAPARLLPDARVLVGFGMAFAALPVLAFAGFLARLKGRVRARALAARLALFLAGAWALFLCLFVPQIILPDVYVPPRAYFCVGWWLAALLVLTDTARIAFLRTLAVGLTVLFLLFSGVYTIALYDVAHRQTQADIRRLNQIVTCIRQRPEYRFERDKKPGLLVVGCGSVSSHVTGSWLITQRALEDAGSIYSAFRHFTDLDFRTVAPKRAKEIAQALRRANTAHEYPDPRAVHIMDGDIVVVMKWDDLDKFLPK